MSHSWFSRFIDPERGRLYKPEELSWWRFGLLFLLAEAAFVSLFLFILWLVMAP